jgi:hypothetical protein
MYDEKIMELRENEVRKELIFVQDSANRLSMPENDTSL